MSDAALALERYRNELTRHCRRVMGSSFEAEDAVQETIVRAWRSIDRFEGRSTLRSWLHRIATNVCVDMLRRTQRRPRPVADIDNVGSEADPAEVSASRDAIRLAFASAVALLPPRQRAALILHDTLQWRASEVADLLDTTEAAVNSAVQRARVTLAAHRPDARPPRLAAAQDALLTRYTERFEHHDIAALVSLIRDDAATGRARNIT
jgi:RNA polymerase sigma-70 factor (ECF subfamily)